MTTCADEPLREASSPASVRADADHTMTQAESEQRYRALFDAIDEGFCIIEMIYDEQQRPLDYRWIEANARFEVHTGLSHPVGRTARQLVPDLDESWFRKYGDVALTRNAIRFQNHAPAMNRWFDVYAFPFGPPEHHQVGLLFRDITPIKRAEIDLEARAQRLELLSDGASALLAADDPTLLVEQLFHGVARLTSVDVFVHFRLRPGATELELKSSFGLPEEQREAIHRLPLGEAVCGLVADQRVPVFIENVQRQDDARTAILRAAGIAHYACFPLIARDEVAGTLSFGTRGEKPFDADTIELLGSVCDLVATAIARRRAEESLAHLRVESEQRSRLYEAIMGATPDLIYVVDNDGCLTYANSALLSAFNVRFSDVDGQSLVAVGFEREHADQHDRAIRRVLDTREPVRGEFDLDLHGSRRTHDYIFLPVINAEGSVEAVAWMTRDVTERKRDEDVLRESERQFRMMADTSPAMLWTTDTDNYCTFLSEPWFAFTGQGGGDGLRFGWLDAVHEDDRTMAQRRFLTAATNRMPLTIDFRLRRHDGSYRWVIDSGQPRFDERGEWLGYVGCVVDVHDRYEATEALRLSERRLRELSASLEQRVAERTAQLREQTVRLRHLAARLTSAEQRERKRLAAILHDDLQQLLFAAGMQLSMIQEQTQDRTLHARIGAAAARIDAAANAARDLTRQLRPPALYEAGLVPALRWLAADMSSKHDVEVVLHVRSDGPILRDDENALLYDAVRELLFNAVKHAAVDSINLDIAEVDDRLRIVVADAGAGFDVESMSELSADSFGLFSVRERLIALGGTMTISSSRGEGTEIALVLPMIAEASAITTPTGADHQDRQAATAPERPILTSHNDVDVAAGRRVSIVVVDDHAIVREGIASTLAVDDRLEVLGGAADGLEALDVLAKDTPDVVLIDLNMPQMNGIEATRRIRDRWAGIGIIGMSVQGDETTAGSMIDAGADAFVPKSGHSYQMIQAILKVARARSTTSSGAQRG
jgi:PAS domain S-box-containing protein